MYTITWPDGKVESMRSPRRLTDDDFQLILALGNSDDNDLLRTLEFLKTLGIHCKPNNIWVDDGFTIDLEDRNHYDGKVIPSSGCNYIYFDSKGKFIKFYFGP